MIAGGEETYVVVQNTGKATLRPELGHVDECEGVVRGLCVVGVVV